MSLRRLLEIALLGIFFSRTASSKMLHLRPLGGELLHSTNQTYLPQATAEPISAVNLSQLIECTDFKDVDLLDVQLEEGGPIWQFHQLQETSNRNYFVGLTKNHSARASFFRLEVQSLGIHLVTGALQDSNMGFWYEIKPNLDGMSLVTVVADTEMAPFAEPVLPPLTPLLFDDNGSYHQETTITVPPTSLGLFGSIESTLQEARKLVASFLPTMSFPQDDLEGFERVASREIRTVDIMVVWTHKAECVKSHLPPSCSVSTITHQNMKLAIHFFLEESNTAFANSGLKLRLRLANGSRVNYQESTFAQALNDLKNEHIPSVQERRQQYKADLVMMLIDRSEDFPETGLAYNNYNHMNAKFMYSVVATQFTSVWYLPSHEIAHNFGCSHDRGTLDLCHDKERTSYGYRDPKGKFRDIMSYPFPTRECDQWIDHGRSYHRQEEQQKLPCPIIPYFSNNRKEGRYYGEPLGGPDNNCAGQIERVQETIASLY